MRIRLTTALVFLVFLMGWLCFTARAQIIYPPGGVGTSVIACVGNPGNTTGTYRQLCQTSGGALYACNNPSGCTVAADWVAQGAGATGTVNQTATVTSNAVTIPLSSATSVANILTTVALTTSTGSVTTVSTSGTGVAGQVYTIKFTQDSTGGNTVSGWPGTFLQPCQVATDASSYTTMSFAYDGTNFVKSAACGSGTTWSGISGPTSTCPVTVQSSEGSICFDSAGVKFGNNGGSYQLIGSNTPAFSALTGGSNSTATMLVVGSASFGPSGTGIVNANEVNGQIVPASKSCIASGSGGILTANCTGQIVITLPATSGQASCAQLSYNGAITAATIVEASVPAVNATATLDLWVGSYQPTVSNSIIGGGTKPSLSSATSGTPSITGWTTTLTAGQYICGHVDSASAGNTIQLTLSTQRN